MGNLGDSSQEPGWLIRAHAGVKFKRGIWPLMVMARKDSITWFMMGIAQILIGEAIVDAGASEFMGALIQWSGGGTLALGLYFLLFIARNESEFTELYSKAEKTILQVDPATGRKELVDDSPKAVKAAWYSIPVMMTFIGAMAWLVQS